MRVLIVLCCVGWLHGCDSYPGSSHPGKEQVLRALKDPASAQWRDLKIVGDRILCGEVNAKNSMGGYVGFSRFISRAGESVLIDGEQPTDWRAPNAKQSTEEIMAQLQAQTDVLESAAARRDRISESERERLGWRLWFDREWKRLCA